ncbi:MAG: hypothetical protein AAFO02_00555 [Bacteroidota bacterium]
MAGKTIEQLQQELAQAQKEKAELQAAMDTAKQTGVVSPVVAGTFKYTGTSANGKKTTGSFKFKPGRTKTPIKLGTGTEKGQLVPSTALMALANGTAMDKIKGLESFPWFKQLTKEAAQAELNWLVENNASTIETAK